MYTFVKIAKENIKILANIGTVLAKLNWPNHRSHRPKLVNFGNVVDPIRLPLLMLSLLSILFFGSLNAEAATTYYIRAGATGTNNGSDWNNAYTSFSAAGLNGSSSTSPRGNTYYVADGSYGGITFKNSASGSSAITIKKATASDHGTATGWSSNYGDGQASFGSWNIKTGYWIIDGNIDTTDTYGFSVTIPTGFPNQSQGILIYDSAKPISNIILRSIDVAAAAANESRGIKFNAGLNENCIVDHVRIYKAGNDAFLLHSLKNSTISDVHIVGPNRVSGSSVHPDAFEIQAAGTVGGNTIKNSRVNWKGQGVFWGAWPPDPNHGIWYIYGNMFWVDYGVEPTSDVTAIKNRSSNPLAEAYIYNNSFYNCVRPYSLGSAVTGDIRNNVAFGMTGTPSTASAGSATHDYNYYETGDSLLESNVQTGGNPYVDVQNADFGLSAATDAGDSTIGATYNTDMDGTTRGTGGIWDRGAYEFVSGAPPAIAAPSNFRRVNTN